MRKQVDVMIIHAQPTTSTSIDVFFVSFCLLLLLFIRAYMCELKKNDAKNCPLCIWTSMNKKGIKIVNIYQNMEL